MRVRIGTQNMTEGPITNDLRVCDALALQEIDRNLVRRGLGSGWEFYFPDEDHHQALAWKKSVFGIDARPSSHRFHRSGKADPQIPDQVRTPSRWLHEAPLYHKQTEEPLDLFGTWAINSWNPFKADQWTDERRWLFEDKTWPVISRQLAQSDKQDHLAILGGDLNSVRAAYEMRGYRSFPMRGLDRQFYSRDRRLKLVEWHYGAKTGVGKQLRHKSLIGTYEITRGGK